MAQLFWVTVPPGNEPADKLVCVGRDLQLTAQTIEDAEGRRLKFFQAAECYRRALRMDPAHVIAMMNLGILYAQTGNMTEAVLSAERSLLFNVKNYIVPLINLAFMYLEVERIEQALATAQRAVEMCPDHDTPAKRSGYLNSRLALGAITAMAGSPGEAVKHFNAILDVEPSHSLAADNAVFMRSLSHTTPAEMRAQQERWRTAYWSEYERRPHDNDREPRRRLRIGYCSGDFNLSSAAEVFGGVVLNHDREQFEVFLYSSPAPDKTDEDALGERFRAAGQYRDIRALPIDQAAELIRQDKIDILVDLAGCTRGGRLPIFMHKPAPIQVTAWGFAIGTGCQEVDYYFADPVAVPLDERQHYAEKIWDLPSVCSFMPPDYGLPGNSQPPFERNGFVTFGCHARYEKLSDECLVTFAEILKRVPNSRMEFKDKHFQRPASIRRVRSVMGGDPSRLLFGIESSHSDHMLFYQRSDLCLDPWPHSGGVVALEQLHMGVPVLTLRGGQPSGRIAASILTAMDRPKWIAETREEYVEKAVMLTSDPVRLGFARETLRRELMESPIVAGYRERVEKAYREMWEAYCAN